MNILLLYGANATHTGTVMEHVESFRRFSRHRVYFSSVHDYQDDWFPALDAFDAVTLHYSFFPGLRWSMPARLEERLAAYRGLKILFAQDEYDHTAALRSWIDKLGVRCMFTCVPERDLDTVYRRGERPRVEFLPTLTGYVPAAPAQVRVPPLAERKLAVGYRGRALHARYGDLAREKLVIGERMREACERRGLAADIDSAEDRRIYGDAWFAFLASCRATLGTESGSNVLDEDGSLRARIDAALAEEPGLTYQAIRDRFIGARDGAIRMNQVSPRIFEAILMRTALILFEGDYSGVVAPWQHYLPLKKDFSNVDAVLDKLDDLPFLEAMTQRAHRDVVESGKYSYAAFIAGFDACVESRVKPAGATLLHAVAGSWPAAPAGRFVRVPCSVATERPLRADWFVEPAPSAPRAPEPPPGFFRRLRSLIARQLS